MQRSASHQPNIRDKRHFRLFATVVIGCVFGVLCALIMENAHKGAGDFGWALRAARDLLANRDVYGYPPGPQAIPYPLPAAFVALPLVGFPDAIAGGIFLGLSSAACAWCLLSKDERWKLLFFLAWPYYYSLLFVQWSALLTCVYFTSLALPLLLVKPQIALPLALTRRPSWQGVALTVAIFALSLVLYPTWPWVWWNQIGSYQGAVPPLFTLPLGPLLLLGLRRYRERRAWLFILLAATPQRMIYDQLPLLLVANNRRELTLLVVCSWVSLPVLWFSPGWSNVPGGWQLWVIITLYLPALWILLKPDISRLMTRRAKSKA